MKSLKFGLIVLFLLINISLGFTIKTAKVDSEIEKQFEKVKSESQGNEKEIEIPVIIQMRTSELNVKQQKELAKSGVLENEFKTENVGLTLRFFSGKMTEKGLNKLKYNEEIESISYDYPVKLSVNTAQINSSVLNTKIIDNLNITGVDNSACVVDSGVDYTHESLGECFGSGCKIVGGYDYANDDSNPLDDNGHGTHVAGIVAGNGTIVGVAPGANIVALKVLDSSGGGSTSDVASGIDWCITYKENYNITSMTLSLALTYANLTEKIFSSYCDSSDTSGIAAAASEAASYGIFVAAAAGNDGSTEGISSPACGINVTSVGAVNSADSILYNRGSILDVLAPGVDILSTSSSQGSVCGAPSSDGSGTCSGTSMATPHVAGAAILIVQYKRLESNTTLTPQEIESYLNSTGILINDASSGLNFQRIDILNATIISDGLAPALELSSPLNQTYNYNESLILNYTTSDIFLESVWYGVDNTNNLSLNGEIEFNVSDGSHSLFLYSNDSKGNINATQLDFTASGDLPLSYIISPSDNYIGSTGNFTVICNATDNVLVNNISLYHNLTDEFVLNQTTEILSIFNETEFNITNVPDNTSFIFGCYAADATTEGWFSENRTAISDYNDVPIFLDNFNDLSWNEDTSIAMNLSLNFSDPDHWDTLTFRASETESISISIENLTGIATFTPTSNWYGSENVVFYAYDSSFASIESNNITLTVSNTADCGDGNKESGEGCDDGNTASGDGCSNSCQTESSGGGSSGGGGGGGGSSTIASTPVILTRIVTSEIKPVITSSGPIIEEKEYENLVYSENDYLAKVELDNSLKQTAESIFGKEYSKKIINSAEVSKSIKSSKRLEINEDKSELSVKIEYTGEKNINKLYIYDEVDKRFAENADQIEVITNANITIIQADPIFMFTFENVKMNESQEIKYSVNKKVDLKISEIKESVFLSDIKEEVDIFEWYNYLGIAFILVSLTFGIIELARYRSIKNEEERIKKQLERMKEKKK